MSRLPKSPQIAALIALTGCTAAFLASQDAAAYPARPPASRPVFRPTLQPRPAVQPRPTMNIVRPVAPSFRPALVQRPMTLTRPATPFARPVTFPQRVAYPQSSFPRPGLAGGFPRPALGAHFPNPGSVGSGFPRPLAANAGFPRPLSASTGFPRPNSVGGGFPHTASLGRPDFLPRGGVNHPLQQHSPLTGANPRPASGAGATAPRSNLHSFSIGSIPVIGPAVNAASKTLGDIAKGDIQKVPGDIASGPIKVVKGTIDQLNPKPAKVTEPKGSTTSDKDFTPAPKLSPVQAALILKHLNDLKAAQAAKQAQQGSQTNPGAGTTPSTGSTPADPSKGLQLIRQRILEAKIRREAEQNRILKAQLAVALGQARQNQFPVFQPANVQSGSGSRPVFQQGGGRPSGSSAGMGGGSGGGMGGGAPASTGGSAPSQPAPASSAPAVAPVQSAMPPLPATGPASASAASAPLTAPQPAVTPAPVQAAAAADPTFVFVGFRQDLSAADMAAFLQAYKVSVVEGPSQDGVYKLRLNDQLPANLLSQLIESMKGQTNIVTAAALS